MTPMVKKTPTPWSQQPAGFTFYVWVWAWAWPVFWIAAHIGPFLRWAP